MKSTKKQTLRPLGWLMTMMTIMTMLFLSVTVVNVVADSGADMHEPAVQDQETALPAPDLTDQAETDTKSTGTGNSIKPEKDIDGNGEESNDSEADVCGLWFAKSSIPGAGLGMYAGKPFHKGDDLLPSGDVVVPVVDIRSFGPKKERKNWIFLWDEYTWSAEGIFLDHEGIDVSGASFGFGAAVNCFLDLVNVDENYPDLNSTGLHRSKDPGAGAFSYYHNRETKATKPIDTGNELFTSYGNNWFTSRKSLPPIPLKGDLIKGNKLIMKYRSLVKMADEGQLPILKAMVEQFVWKNPWDDVSRILFGLPKTWEEMEEAMKIGLYQLRRNQHSKPLEWLEEHGACGDNIKEGLSSLPQAGRGAFAVRPLSKGSIVSPWPLIHMSYRKRLAMNHTDGTMSPSEQQLINYCMGHKDTTMILCQYATLSALVNHNQTQANVYLRWAPPERSNHQPDWLNRSLKDLSKLESAGLAMELVASRDIAPDEEIFLDYGDDWEAAWKAHVDNWKPLPNADKYISGEQLFQREKVLKTVFEEIKDPYPNNVQLMVDDSVVGNTRWMPAYRKGTLRQYFKKEDKYRYKCDIIQREVDENGDVWYSGVSRQEDEETGKTKPFKFSKVPKEAFTFIDVQYTSDFHLENAFRQPMGIPDELLPDAWKTTEDEGDPEIRVKRKRKAKPEGYDDKPKEVKATK